MLVSPLLLVSLAGGNRQLRLDAQEENWELEDLEQLQGELCRGQEGRQEGRCQSCWGRGRGLGVLGRRGEGRERGFMWPQSSWDRAEEPRSGAREGGSSPLGFRLTALVQQSEI